MSNTHTLHSIFSIVTSGVEKEMGEEVADYMANKKEALENELTRTRLCTYIFYATEKFHSISAKLVLTNLSETLLCKHQHTLSTMQQLLVSLHLLPLFIHICSFKPSFHI